MNLFPAIVGGDGMLVLDGLDAKVVSPVEGLSAGREVVLGCRPQHVALSGLPDLVLPAPARSNILAPLPTLMLTYPAMDRSPPKCASGAI